MKPARYGTLIIKPEAARKENEGGIFIPLAARRIRSRVGKVMDILPYPADVPFKVWRNGKKIRRIFNKQENAELLTLKGQYVLVGEGIQFQGQDKVTYIMARIEHIEAIVDAPEELEVVADAIPRCPRCKSTGESNLLLDDKGYCPRCGMNAAGERREDRQMNVSGDLSEFMAGRDARDDIRKKRGKASKETIMSWSGQKHHSKLNS